MTFFWKCCGEEHPAASLKEAQLALEEHEREEHGKKPVGSFGIYYKEANEKYAAEDR